MKELERLQTWAENVGATAEIIDKVIAATNAWERNDRRNYGRICKEVARKIDLVEHPPVAPEPAPKPTLKQVAALRRIVADFDPGSRAKVGKTRKAKLRKRAAEILGLQRHPGIGEIIALAGLDEYARIRYPGPEAHIEQITAERQLWLSQGIAAAGLGENIAIARNELGLTQEMCAARAESISQSQWAEYEAGTAGGMTINTLAQISAVLGVHAGDLLPF